MGNSKAFNQPFTFDTNLNLNHHGNPATSVVDDIKARGAGKRQITEAQANDPAFVKQYGDYYTGSNGQKASVRDAHRSGGQGKREIMDGKGRIPLEKLMVQKTATNT